MALSFSKNLGMARCESIKFWDERKWEVGRWEESGGTRRNVRDREKTRADPLTRPN